MKQVQAPSQNSKNLSLKHKNVLNLWNTNMNIYCVLSHQNMIMDAKYIKRDSFLCACHYDIQRQERYNFELWHPRCVLITVFNIVVFMTT